jgi:hypothetical protein
MKYRLAVVFCASLLAAPAAASTVVVALHLAPAFRDLRYELTNTSLMYSDAAGELPGGAVSLSPSEQAALAAAVALLTSSPPSGRYFSGVLDSYELEVEFTTGQGRKRIHVQAGCYVERLVPLISLINSRVPAPYLIPKETPGGPCVASE